MPNIPYRLAESPIHGMGVFANQSIDSGTYADLPSDYFFEGYAGINHSCNPNCKINSENNKLVILTNIAADEELTVSYSKWNAYEPGCNCITCRKIK